MGSWSHFERSAMGLSSTRVRFSLLGPPVIDGPVGPRFAVSPQLQALVWYLCAHPDRPVARATLGNLFWDADEHTVRRNLSTALWRLHKELPDLPIAMRGDFLVWESQGPIWLDTLAFDALVRTGDGPALEQAIALWRGPFLDGFVLPAAPDFAEWLACERRHWEQRYLGLVLRLAEQAAGEAQWDRVVTLAGLGLAADPLEERLHQLLMQGYFGVGNKAAALRQFEVLRRIMQDELGAEPGQQTQALRATIAHAAPALDPAPPTPLRAPGLLRSTLAALAEPTRNLLFAAALFQRGAPYAALCHLVGVTEDAALAVVETLLDAGWIEERTAGPLGPVLGFPSEETRAFLDAELSLVRRRSLHRRAYTYLHALVPEGADAAIYVNAAAGRVDDLAVELAWHAWGALLWPEAAHWCQVVADAAERLDDYALAATYLERAVGCLEQLPPSQKRRAAVVDMRLRLTSLGVLFQVQRAEDWNLPAVREVELLPDSERKLAVWLRQVGVAMVKGQTNAISAMAGRLTPLVRLTRNRQLIAGVLLLQGNLQALRGEYEAAIETLRECLRFQEGALESIHRSRARARELKTTWALDLLHVSLAEVCLLQGNLKAAASAIATAQHHAGVGAHRYGLALARKVRGQLSWAAGDQVSARQDLLAALHELRAIDARPQVARCLAVLAEAGDTPAECRAALAEATELFTALGMDWDLHQLERAASVADAGDSLPFDA
jgi:DNA-binding SARP family transcriptional activator